MKLGGYGMRPGTATPFGRRGDVFTATIPPEPPTEDWASLLRSGCGHVRGVLIDGIPYVFGERQLYTIAGVEAAPPTDDHTRSAAWAIMPGVSVSCEPDREKGVAAGRALDILLRRQSLEDEGLSAVLFKDAGLTATLTTDVIDADTTTFDADSTSGWDPDGGVYIGREFAKYTSSSATSFDGLTRGVAGLAHYHAANPQSGYSAVTDVPQHWRGRLIEVFEHLIGPDGRFFGTHWCVTSTYCRQTWRGYIDAEPQETAFGKVLRCLPIVRLAGQEVGAKFVFDVAMNSAAEPLLWFNTTDRIAIHAEGSVDGFGPHDGGIGQFATLGTWCGKAGADITSDMGVNGRVIVTADVRRPQRDIFVTVTGAVTSNATLQVQAWFLVNGSYGTAPGSNLATGFVRIPIDFDASPSAWLVLRAVASEDFAAADVPQSGTAVIESTGKRERVRWDAKRTVATQPDLIALRLVEREVDGTPRTDPFRWGGRVTVIAGATGSWSDTFRTLLTSSGTGDRGPFDTLGFGFGIGLPDEWLGVDSFDDEPMASSQVSAAADQRRSIEDVLGGWLALWSRCLVQRRNAAGNVVLMPVSTVVSDDPSAPSLGAADVLLDGHGTPEVVEAPNTLKLDASGYESDTETTIYRDVARVQAEGQRMWTLLTPGGSRDQLAVHAPGMLFRIHGQAAVALEAPPWCELQPGDQVDLTTAHPTVYDWSTGAYAPASARAVVMSWERDIYSDVVKLTLLLQGRGAANALLCPTAVITRVVSSLVVEVREGEEGLFVVADQVAVYQPGNETAASFTATIDAIDEDAHTITLDTTLSAFVAPGCCVTFDDHATTANDQADYMFVRSDKRWR